MDIEALSMVGKLFGAIVLVVNVALYFLWVDARQHVEVWGSERVGVCTML